MPEYVVRKNVRLLLVVVLTLTVVSEPSNCDLLGVYSGLCSDMPDMGQCGAWTDLCHAEPHWPYCSSK